MADNNLDKALMVMDWLYDSNMGQLAQSGVGNGTVYCENPNEAWMYSPAPYPGYDYHTDRGYAWVVE